MHLLMTVIHSEWARGNPAAAKREGRALPSHGAAIPRNGQIVLIDWDEQEIVWSSPFDAAAGFCVRDDALFVASMLANTVKGFDDTAGSTTELRNSLFNDLHSVLPTERGLLIASSGIDGIVEVDVTGQTCWWWSADRHALDRLPDGRRRRVDARRDHSRDPVLSAGMQATHVNSAAPTPQGTILATLFAQGDVIEIDPADGGWERRVTGLHHPHSIRPAPDGWTVCDTSANAVVLLDHELSIETIVSESFQWVQDAFIAPGDGNLFVLDANNTRVVELDPGTDEVINSLAYPKEWKAYGLDEVPATMLAPDRDAAPRTESR